MMVSVLNPWSTRTKWKIEDARLMPGKNKNKMLVEQVPRGARGYILCRWTRADIKGVPYKVFFIVYIYKIYLSSSIEI